MAMRMMIVLRCSLVTLPPAFEDVEAAVGAGAVSFWVKVTTLDRLCESGVDEASWLEDGVDTGADEVGGGEDEEDEEEEEADVEEVLLLGVSTLITELTTLETERAAELDGAVEDVCVVTAGALVADDFAAGVSWVAEGCVESVCVAVSLLVADAAGGAEDDDDAGWGGATTLLILFPLVAGEDKRVPARFLIMRLAAGA
jgi:hypothetical protein